MPFAKFLLSHGRRRIQNARVTKSATMIIKTPLLNVLRYYLSIRSFRSSILLLASIWFAVLCTPVVITKYVESTAGFFNMESWSHLALLEHGGVLWFLGYRSVLRYKRWYLVSSWCVVGGVAMLVFDRRRCLSVKIAQWALVFWIVKCVSGR